MNYYNEFDPFAAQWLRELIADKLIPDGYVDERSIRLVQPQDLRGYTQCHFFAGIGGWPLALELAGWPADRPVWTGSCPCQPFSQAGNRKGVQDERHLWPEFLRLIAECRPASLLGEQVASPAGRRWFSGVRTDMEGVGYRAGGADLCAAGLASPHIRQRLYWVADAADSDRRGRERGAEEGAGADGIGRRGSSGGGIAGRVGESFQSRLEGLRGNGDDGDQPGRLGAESGGSTSSPGSACGMADTDGRQSSDGGVQRGGKHGQRPKDVRAGFWGSFDILHCTDGKARRVESGTFPLAHGVQARMGKLRAYGNAIVPQVAAEFVRAYLETVNS